MNQVDEMMDRFRHYWLDFQRMLGLDPNIEETITRLRQLKEALDAGLISESDYNEKKGEILRQKYSVIENKA